MLTKEIIKEYLTGLQHLKESEWAFFLAQDMTFLTNGIGIAALFSPIQSVVNLLASVQGVWWLCAAITLLVRAGKASDSELSLAQEFQAEEQPV